MFQAGQKVAHFEIVNKLGEGGMGEVFLVLDTKLHRKAAMKVQHLDNFEDKERRERFVREAQTAAQINHSNVMGIYDIGIVSTPEGKEISYIVMEYLPGRSLNEVMRTTEFDLADMVRIAEKIASGLAAAHRLNIVHRDIKADNIIIDENGDPKILDFGLAKPSSTIEFEGGERSTKTVSQELTRAGKILGTVSYMSPEQARGEKVDIRSDVFSFGILLYKMVTGELPFDGPTQVSTLAKILEAQPQAPSVKNQNIPPELERIIDKCLEKDPGDRYQGASDLAVDLRHVRKQFDSGITDTVTTISGERLKQLRMKSGSSILVGMFSSKKAGLAVGAIVLFLTLGYFGVGLISGGGTNSVLAQANSLAILGFENKTGDESFDWLKTGLSEILLTDLAQTPSLKVISHERILDCFPDRKAAHTHEQCVKAAQSLGASKLLSGTFYRLGDQIRIDARLEDLASGNIILTEKVIGTDAFSLVDSLTTKLASSLNISDMDRMNTVSMFTSSSEEAYKHYLVGMEQFQEQRWVECRESFNSALAIDSTFAMPYLRLGMSYIFDGRMQQGLPYFRKAKEYESKLPPRDRDLLDIYSDIWLKQEFDPAFTKLGVFVRNYPDDKEGRSIYGILIYQFQRDTVRAFAQLDSALMLDPMCLLSHMFIMNIAVQSGDIDKTIKTAQEIKKFYPKAPLAYEELGRAYRLQMEYDKAINEYKQLYAGFPSSIWALLEISELFEIKRQFDSANYYANRAYQVSGSDPVELRRFSSSMAGLKIWEGQFKKAIHYQKQAVDHARETKDSNTIKNDLDVLGRFYFRIDKKDSARICFEESYKLSTSMNKVSYPFVLIDLDYNRREEAKKIFRRDLPELRAKLPKDLLKIVDAIEKMFEAAYDADTVAFIAAAKELKKIQPGSNTSLDTWELGVMLISFRQYEEGKELLNRFVQGKDQTTSAFIYLMSHFYLGQANEGLNNKKEAIKNYNEVLKYWKNPDIEIKFIRDTRERLVKLSA